MRHYLPIAIALLFALSHSAAAAQEKDKKTHKVKQDFFEVIEEVTATVESKNMAEVEAETEAWTNLVIREVVPEGTPVEAGATLVWFKTDKIDRKIKESEFALRQAEFALSSAKVELDTVLKTYDLDKTLADRKKRNVEEDFRYFNDVERPNRERSARRSIENSQHSLEYAQEEFNQLERMYEEDELTEESEEIVLKRTRRDVENRQFFLEQTQLRVARQLDIDLPRELEQKQDALERARLEFERAGFRLDMARDMKTVAVAKSEATFQHQQEDFNKLLEDRKQMEVAAPVAGVLYYGKCVRGKWVGPAGPGRDLSEGKVVPPNKTIVTIVDPRQVMLRADLSESQLAGIRAGSEGLATPAAFPNSPMSVRVDTVSYVPVQAGKFDCQMAVSELPDGLMPGMTCKVRFLLRRNPSAITVPESAVFSDDGINRFVYVVDGENHSRRAVTTGLTSEKNIEVLTGLSSGDEILTERPQEQE